jgi:DNA-binding response OmpR family regulator
VKLLIAESDGASRRALAALLSSDLIEVIEAGDGPEAIHRIDTEAPAVILLDWWLLGFTGLDICMRVRQRNLQLRPYIVMVSSGHSTDDVVSAFAAGADDCVTRPVDEEQLCARVQGGVRLVLREHALVLEHAALQSALRRMHGMPELVPICSCC